MNPSRAQAEAILAIIDWYRDSNQQEFYLAGYAGVGKTTLAGWAIEELGLARVMTGAYTGKAAHVLRQKGAPNPGTIHSMIYEPIPGSDPVQFTLASYPPLCEADLLVIDESSMVPDDIADDLRSKARRILVLGDPGQLPPVRGLGAFTRRKPDVMLTEIHRQAADSPIIRLATLARQGKPLPAGLAGHCEVVSPRNAFDSVEAARDGAQVICGVHRVRWTLTAKLRADAGHSGPLPAPGEPLICCRNNHELGLFNGMACTLLDEPVLDDHDGTIQLRIRTEAGYELEVWSSMRLFREHVAGPQPQESYRRGVELFDWAYVLTCHKAQGSEFPNVLLLDDSRWFREDAKRWLYTGITRAQERLTVRLR